MATTCELLRDPRVTPLQKNIISVLKDSGPITRNKLVEKLDRARTTIYDNLAKLMKNNRVRSFPSHDGKKRGRPLVLFELTYEA